jgi:hypothetical protein
VCQERIDTIDGGIDLALRALDDLADASATTPGSSSAMLSSACDSTTSAD